MSSLTINPPLNRVKIPRFPWDHLIQFGGIQAWVVNAVHMPSYNCMSHWLIYIAVQSSLFRPRDPQMKASDHWISGWIKGAVHKYKLHLPPYFVPTMMSRAGSITSYSCPHLNPMTPPLPRHGFFALNLLSLSLLVQFLFPSANFFYVHHWRQYSFLMYFPWYFLNILLQL